MEDKNIEIVNNGYSPPSFSSFWFPFRTHPLVYSMKVGIFIDKCHIDPILIETQIYY